MARKQRWALEGCAFETTTKDNFEWEDWHKRGIELAKQLRAKLPKSCDLWYDAPFEDKSGTIKERFLVMPP